MCWKGTQEMWVEKIWPSPIGMSKLKRASCLLLILWTYWISRSMTLYLTSGSYIPLSSFHLFSCSLLVSGHFILLSVFLTTCVVVWPVWLLRFWPNGTWSPTCMCCWTCLFFCVNYMWHMILLYCVRVVVKSVSNFLGWWFQVQQLSVCKLFHQ
jgi:hypothetical protein